MIGSGKTHVHTVVSMAQSQLMDAINAGTDVPEAVRSFASLGAYGAQCQNEERDLHKWLSNLHQISLEPYHIQVKVEVGIDRKCMFHHFWTP